jgi:hypothetical protein
MRQARDIFHAGRAYNAARSTIMARDWVEYAIVFIGWLAFAAIVCVFIYGIWYADTASDAFMENISKVII